MNESTSLITNNIKQGFTTMANEDLSLNKWVTWLDGLNITIYKPITVSNLLAPDEYSSDGGREAVDHFTQKT